MDGLVALASAKSTDPGTIQATFEAYAAVAKKQSGEASFAMKVRLYLFYLSPYSLLSHLS